jgi:hypothetical protein
LIYASSSDGAAILRGARYRGEDRDGNRRQNKCAHAPLAFSFFSLVLQLLMVLFVPSERARKLDGAAASLFLQ